MLTSYCIISITSHTDCNLWHKLPTTLAHAWSEPRTRGFLIKHMRVHTQSVFTHACVITCVYACIANVAS